ncbi:hypothetical protein NDU88_008727 [Pleurodeles waltl]|uniref:Uncharacterized protein n=1 Tax=Pleurodeles waltl TaxID=8319 RepID=A0AAV7PT17_PLEWA|nr:hypothetical protein NDU88_008727 [Pleurodeles waltl]
MPPSPHMSQRTVPMKDNSEHRVRQLRGEDLHCKCCCDLSLEETMARMSGERAPAFTSEELEKRVDGVLPQYTLLYCPPDKQVSAHQKKERYLVCHRQGRPDPGGLPQTEHPLPEKMGGHSPLEQEDGGGSAGDGFPTWEGCPSNHDPPDVQDPGGGLPGVGWALEGITADTRGIIRRRSSGTGARGSCIPHGPEGRDYRVGIHQWDRGQGELHGGDRS